MNCFARKVGLGAVAASLMMGTGTSLASSHMDAPLITFDDAANTTDVYAFVDGDGDEKNLVVALGVYPFEEPGIGPNKYNFDDNVLYEIHVALGDDVADGRKTLSYQWRFTTEFQDVNTILQSYRFAENGVVDVVDADNPDPDQNLIQRYTVTMIDHRVGNGGDDDDSSDDSDDGGAITVLGSGIVPPNNQGRVTPFYNQDDFGDAPAKQGVATEEELDRYTAAAIAHLDDGYTAFAGQRDDGFFANIQAVFDLLALGPQFDSQGGFNLHLMALEIPVSELDGDQQVVGVYATTSRQRRTILSRKPEKKGDKLKGEFIQVARQGNPLFNEALVAIVDKDLYSRTSPERDSDLFRKYAESPELAKLLNFVIVPNVVGLDPAIENGRSDLAAIYIPDLIKVDLSTDGVRFAGGGPDDPVNPDDEGFSRLSIFGGDVLATQIEDHPFFIPGVGVPGGWPNGRRFGDDVLDIAVSAVLSDLRGGLVKIQVAGDGVDSNDMAFNKVFPYESTPQNGRVHAHHGEEAVAL